MMAWPWQRRRVLLLACSLPAIAANDKDAIGPVEVSSAVYSDVSPALRDLSGFNPSASTDKEKKEKPLRILPNMGNAVDQIDGALQISPGPLAGTTGGLNFAGVGQGDYGFTDQYAPPGVFHGTMQRVLHDRPLCGRQLGAVKVGDGSRPLCIALNYAPQTCL